MDEPDDKDVAVPQKAVALKHFKRLLPLFSRLHEVGCERDTAGNRQFVHGWLLRVGHAVFV
jgi:hypothetical protein